MVSRLKIKLGSQRGASLSVALLLFLVCAALSAVILAAATATTGQFAERSKADQRYYAVTSAAELFTGSLDGGSPDGVVSAGDNTLTFQVVQEKTSQYRTTGGVRTLVPDTTTAAFHFNKPTESTRWFNFLPSATLYAFTGDAEKTESNLSTALEEGTWIEPFTLNNWAALSPSVNAEKFSYSVTPSFTGTSLPSSATLTVDVDGTLRRGDWVFDLQFSNGVAPRDYNMYVVLAADVTTPAATSTVTETVVDGDSIIETIKETRTTAITWSVDRVATGWSGYSE